MKKRKTKKDNLPPVTDAKTKSPSTMTAREYFATPEGQLKQQKIADDLLKKFLVTYQPTLDQLQRVAEDAYKAMANSGILDAVKSLSQYSDMMKISYDALILPMMSLEKKEMIYFAPSRREEPAKAILGDEEIHRIVAELDARESDKMSRMLEKILLSQRGLAELNVFILKRDGTLYRASDPRQSHGFRDGADGGMRLGIIKALLGQTSLTPTQKLLEKTYYKTPDSLRKAIGDINLDFRTVFKLKVSLDERFIVSHRPSGYMLNPQYNIMSEDSDI